MKRRPGRPLRICYFGTYRTGYIRNRLMIERLRRQGFEVVECHVALWHGLEDREHIASGGWLNPGFWWRVVSAYARLLWLYGSVGVYDILMIGYPGQPDVILARLLSWIRGKPLVWDVLMSIYLIALERGLDRKSWLTIQLIRRIESFALKLPDRLLIDTPVYAEWFQHEYAIPARKIRLLPLGADDRIFQPIQVDELDERMFICLYHGTFVPSHGVRYIIDAARRLHSDTSIIFELIGRGPELEAVKSLAGQEGLTNLRFIDWMESQDLVKRIARCDICLGTFGSTPQALMTMQNKIHEGLAMRRSIITGDSPLMRSILEHGKHIYLCERERGESLANAILALKIDPDLRKRLAEAGYQYYLENLSMDEIGRRLKEHLLELLKGEAGTFNATNDLPHPE